MSDWAFPIAKYPSQWTFVLSLGSCSSSDGEPAAQSLWRTFTLLATPVPQFIKISFVQKSDLVSDIWPISGRILLVLEEEIPVLLRGQQLERISDLNQI